MDLSSHDLPALGNQAHGHYKAAEKHRERAEQQYRSAGLYLKEAKQRCLQTPGMTFERFLKDHCPIGRSRAYELIAIADGTKSLEEVREGNASRQAAKRHRDATATVRDVTDRQPEDLEMSVDLDFFKHGFPDYEPKPTSDESEVKEKIKWPSMSILPFTLTLSLQWKKEQHKGKTFGIALLDEVKEKVQFFKDYPEFNPEPTEENLEFILMMTDELFKIESDLKAQLEEIRK